MFSNLIVQKQPKIDPAATAESVAVLETLVSALIQSLAAQSPDFQAQVEAAIGRTGADEQIKTYAREALQKSLSRVPG